MKVLIPIAPGSEEMEAVILVDVMRRAEWDVTVAGLEAGPIEASRGVQLMPDCLWDDLNPDSFDMLMLPGGLGGTEAFCEHEGVKAAVRAFAEADKWLGSICAAAKALHAAGVLEGRTFTCYPGVEKQLTGPLTRLDERVVVDRKLVTSQGPGTAFEFALKLIALAESQDRADSVRAGLLL